MRQSVAASAAALILASAVPALAQTAPTLTAPGRTAPATAPPAERAVDTTIAARLRDQALADRTAWELTESLTTEVGPRLGGSPAYDRARDWAVRRLRSLGFRNVRTEEFPMQVWTRGREEAALTGEHAQPLAVTALGGSVATPAEGVEAELAVFPSWPSLLAAPVGSLRGKIAVVLHPMARSQDGSGYGAAGVVRRAGPSEAARRGAVAFMMRSLGSEIGRSPHTGVTRYEDGVPQIPAAAMSTADAEQIGRLAAAGRRLRARLLLTPTSAPGRSFNVVGEIPGRSAPDEVVLLGAHLDSWDLGTGAIDDASGVAIVMATADLIRRAPARPRRTLRVVLYGAEENGPAGEAYASRRTPEELSRIVLVGEADFGADRVWRAALPAGTQQTPWGRAVAETLLPLRIFVRPEPAGSAGVDVAALQQRGAPGFRLDQDGTRYFDYHHTAEDTLDKIDPQQLAQVVAAWTGLIWLAADSDMDFRAAAARAAPATSGGDEH